MACAIRSEFSLDRQTRTMFIGDVGQVSREEVDVQKPSNPGGGENYGWRVREGFIQSPYYSNDPPPPDALDPILDYPHTTGKCMIGGYVYRGNQIPAICAASMFSRMPRSGCAEILRAESGTSVTTGIPFRISKTSLRSCFPPVSAISH